MKILYTATVLSHICQFHLPHIRRLKELGHEVHVAAHDNLAVKNGLKLRYADAFFEIPFHRSPASADNIRAYRVLKALLEWEHYDLILCNTPMGGTVTRLAAMASRRRGTRVLYMAHGFHFYKGASKKAWAVYYPIEKAMAHLCDTVITINEEDFALAGARLKAPSAHIRGVGVSPERYQPVSDPAPLRERLGLAPGDFAVLCTGELNANKDQRTLICAAARLREQIPGLKVLLAGNGPTEEALRAQIRELHLEDTVRLLGYRTDLETIVPAVDLVVSCSRREGLGLNLIEAMLCRRPIIAAENRGHRELVAEGINGFLFAPGDADTLARRIHDIYSDPTLAARMGQAGYDRAQRYTVDAVSDSLIPILLGEVHS